MNNKANNINPFQKFLIAIIGDEKRQKFSVPIFAIILSLFVCSLILIMLDKSPIDTFASFLRGTGLLPKANYSQQKGMITDFMGFVNAWSPMLLAALSVAVSLRAGLLNIGVSGQMLAAGLVTTSIIGYTEMSPFIAKPLVLIISMITGATLSALIGLLKHKFKINEVVSAIMLNYIVQYVASFFIKTALLDHVSRQSRLVTQNARLTLLNVEIGGYKMDIPLGIIVAFICVFIVHFIFKKMKIGFEFTTIGLNPQAANYAGINVGKNIILTTILSGCLAGLAGSTYFLGFSGIMQPDTLISTGFDAIAVSALGGSHPIGIIFSSFFISVIDRGSSYMQSSVGVRQEISSLITGMILLFVSCGTYISYKINKLKQRQIDFENSTKKDKQS